MKTLQGDPFCYTAALVPLDYSATRRFAIATAAGAFIAKTCKFAYLFDGRPSS